MAKWLAAQLKIVSGKSDTAQAIRYAKNHWAGLTLYLEDGRIEMDTNAVERAMRPIKITAKNSLFAGCDDGAQHWSMLALFIETCKLNQVNAESWLADVLTKLVNGWPEAKLEELLPWADATPFAWQESSIVCGPSVPMTMRQRPPGSLPSRSLGTSLWLCLGSKTSRPLPLLAREQRKAVGRRWFPRQQRLRLSLRIVRSGERSRRRTNCAFSASLIERRACRALSGPSCVARRFIPQQ
jgi:hypothetical protein